MGHKRKRRPSLAACAVFALGLGLAACGSSPSAGPGPLYRLPDLATIPPTTTVPPTTVPPTTVPPTTTTTAPVTQPTPAPTPVAAVPGWSLPLTAAPPDGGFTSVSCISDTFCIATGGGAYVADDADTTGPGIAESWDGATWSLPATYFGPASGPVTAADAPLRPAITCTSGPFCVIVDGTDHVSNGDGTNWIAPVGLATAPPLPANPDGGSSDDRTAAVVCPDVTFCAIVDSTGNALAWRSGTWLAPQAFGSASATGHQVAIDATGRVGLACSSTSACTAVVGATVLDWDGTAWTEEPAPWTSSPAVSHQAAAVGCPTASTCFIVGGPDVYVRTGGGSWSPGQDIDPGGLLDALSCPTATFCLAADTEGRVVTWDGTGWAPPVRVLPAVTAYTAGDTSVSCSGADFCMVLNPDGDYTTWSGPPAASAAPTTSTTGPPGA
jgi:hypothetical protein